MKKIICMLCAAALIAALAGCSSNEPPEDVPSAAASAASDASTPEVSPEQEVQPTNAPEAEVTPEPEPTSEPQAQPTDASEAKVTPAQSVDISSAIDAETTSDTSPAPVGQWVKTARYATEDHTYHTVYVRITNVTMQADDAGAIESAIDLHNENSYDYQQIDTSEIKLPSDIELGLLEYEVFVPEDFPAPDYGIVEPTMDFGQGNIGGGGIPSADGTSVYIGLGANSEDLATEKDPTYHPGNTYSFRSLFTMVKGYTDYIFEFISYPDGTEELSADVMYYAYFANK